MSYKHARIKLNYGGLRSIRDTDYFDSDHYGCTPYVDVLFTDDSSFRETIDLIGNPRDRVYDFAELVELSSTGDLP
jgi:hypothetical protein